MIRHHWPRYAAYAVLTCALLLGSFPRSLGGFKPHEIAIVILALALVIHRIARRDWHYPVTIIDAFFALLAFAGAFLPLLSLETRGNFITADDMKSLIGPVSYYLWYRVMVECLPMPEELPRLMRVLLVLFTIIGFVGDLQALHVPGVAQMLSVVSSTHQTAVSGAVQRPTSLVGEWGLMASLCGFALLLINQIQVDGAGQRIFGRHHRAILIAMMVINIAAVVAALAVEAFLALGIGYGILYWLNQRRLARETTIGAGVAGLAAIAIAPSLLLTRIRLQFANSGSIVPMTWQVRFLHWQIVLGSITSGGWNTILFGVSPSFIYPVSQFQGTESLYWLLWYRGGLIYLFAFIAFLCCLLQTAWQARRQSTLTIERVFLSWVFTVIAIMCVIGVIDALMVDGGEAQAIMTVVAALCGIVTSRQVTAPALSTPRLMWRVKGA